MTAEQEIPDEVWTDVYVIATSAARNVARRFGSWVEAEDLRQGACEHALKRRDKVIEYMLREDEADRKRGYAAMHTFLRRFCERQARKEKAEKSGYKATDEYFYKKALIENLIKVAEDGYEVAGQVLAQEDMGGRRAKTQPNEGNNIVALIADTKNAMATLDERTRSILVQRFADDMHLSDIGKLHDISPQRVEQIVQSGIRKMQTALGGEQP